MFVLHPMRECALVTSIIAGRSHRQSAHYAGVSKRTATKYATLIKRQNHHIGMEFVREVRPLGFLKPLHSAGDKIIFSRLSETVVSALAHEGYVFATPRKSMAQRRRSAA